MIPQIIYLVLLIIGLLISANNHGKKKEGFHNFFIDFIGIVIIFLVLYFGGFFEVFGWGIK